MTEADIQTAIVAHFRRHYAGRCAHVANGGYRSKLEAVRLKRMGVEPGCPDLVFWTPRGCYLMEVKRPDGRLSSAQIAFIEDLRDLCFDVAEVRSLDEAKAAFEAWKLPRKPPHERSEAEARTGF